MIHTTIHAGVARIQMDRAPVNAFDEHQVAGLAAAVREVRRSDAGAVLVCATGRHFCAGADIKQVLELLDQPDGPDRGAAFAVAMQSVFAELAELPIPSVAAIKGAATGGGLELAMACDLRIAARSARMGLPEVRLGLLPAAGGTQRLTRLAGPAVAARLMFTGELISAQDALELGLVNWVVGDDEIERQAQEITQHIAAQSRPALAEIKRCIEEAITQTGFSTEIEATRRLHSTPEARIRLREFIGVKP